LKLRRSIAIDAGLLVLLAAGKVSRDHIGKHKRLRAFAAEDYDTLVEIISGASRVVVTPNTLTEASNLAAQIAEPLRTKIRAVLRIIIEETEEFYVASISAAQRREYAWLGLTDAALLDVTDQDVTLLTTDSGLHRCAQINGRDSVNFNHIRDGYY